MKPKLNRSIQQIQSEQFFKINETFNLNIKSKEIANLNKKPVAFKNQQTIQYKMETLQKKSDNLLLKVIAIQEQIQKYSQNQYKEMNYIRINIDQTQKQLKQSQLDLQNGVQKKHLMQLKQFCKVGHQKVQMIAKIQENIILLKQKVLQNLEEPSIMLKQKKQLQVKFKKYYEQNKLINKSKSERFQLLNGQIVSQTNFSKFQIFEFEKIQNAYRSEKISNKKESKFILSNSQQFQQKKIQEVRKEFEQYRQRIQKKINIYQQELSQCFLKQQLLIRQVQKLKYERLAQKIIKTTFKKNQNQQKPQNLQNFKTELNIKFVQENKNQEELQNIKKTLKQLQEANIKLKNNLTLKQCQQLNRIKKRLKEQQEINFEQKNQISKLKEILEENSLQIQEMNADIVQYKQRIDKQQQIIEATQSLLQHKDSKWKKFEIQIKDLNKKYIISSNKQKQLKQLNSKMLKEKQLKNVQFLSKLKECTNYYEQVILNLKQKIIHLQNKQSISKAKIKQNELIEDYSKLQTIKKSRIQLYSKVISYSQIIRSQKPLYSKTQQQVQLIPNLNLKLNFSKQKTKMITTRHPPSKENHQIKIDKFQTIKEQSSVALKKLIQIKFSSKQKIQTSNEEINLKIKLALKLIKLVISIINKNQTKKICNKQGNKKFQSLRLDKLALNYKNQAVINQPTFLPQSLQDKLLTMNQNIQKIQFLIKQNSNDQIDNQKNLVYLSPQVLLGMNQFQFSYCWTIGIIIDQLFHHKLYYNRIEQIIAHKNNYKFDLSDYQNIINKQKTSKIKDLIEKMIVKNYKERLRLVLVQQQLTKILSIQNI